MTHNECKICREKKATPSHVKAAHGMSIAEYKKLTRDEQFMKEVEEHRIAREERESREYHMSRILTYYWYPEPHKLTRVMRRFTDHAKPTAKALSTTVDLSEYEGMDKVIVGKVEVAEAMTEEGWECILTKGGHDGSPKEYHMQRI